MVRKGSKPPPSDRVSIRRFPKSHPRNASSPPSSSPTQHVTQPVPQSTRSESIPGSTPECDWTSAFGLSQSDIQRASMSSSIPKRNTKANQQANRKNARNGALASIMTSLNGVSMYSQGASAYPLVSSVGSAAELQDIIFKNSTPATGKILLPRPDPTPRLYRSAYASSSYPFAKPTAPPTHHQQTPSESTTPQDPPPFHPTKCHWRALRDVAFVLDGGMDLSSEDLCALLRFRYAKTDPLMARVELADLQAMYVFCKGWPKEMYEKHAGGRIRLEMGQDLKLMREGGVGGVNEDF